MPSRFAFCRGLVSSARNLCTVLAVLVATAACVPSASKAKRPLIETQKLEGQGTVKVLVVGSDDMAGLRASAASLGLQVAGNGVLEISGPATAVRELQVSAESDIDATLDAPVIVRGGSAAAGDGSADVDPSTLYLARKDFGIPEHLADHPTHDGRGVIAGVVDDGISPSQSGFQTTTTGQRKFIARGETSTMLRLPILPNVEDFPASSFMESAGAGASGVAFLWSGKIDETREAIDSSPVDFNGDGAHGTIEVGAIQFAAAEGGETPAPRICIDRNVNRVADAGECFGAFAETGEWGYWTRDQLVSVVGDFDAVGGELRLSQGERSGDSHGEGVASVLAGHRIAGRFDGVAPGAQLIDYDISGATTDLDERAYTIGTFLRAFDFLGVRGAEVINVSYSLFFTSANSQLFMRRAISALVSRYNFVISFSAGNNGPGLGSFNRGMIYPYDVLVAGAFVGPELDAHVHGVTGLPKQGRVVWYSSRGPAPDGGSTPTVISPLASLTHSEPDMGFGAFSGTSSASPALAGLAALVISAAKQEGLAIDAGSVVHAIRMSARPIAGAPFVFQGAGMPNLTRALAAYRRILNGTDFRMLETTLPEPAADGVPRSGLVLRASSAPAAYTTSFDMVGKLAATAPAARAQEILKTLRIEYSHPFLRGTERSFVSVGGSVVHFEVRVAEALAAMRADRASGSEVFGEIRLIDEETGSVLQVVPVTIIDDVLPNSPGNVVQWSASLGAEDGARHHLNVLPGTSGISIRGQAIETTGESMLLRVYDPNGNVVTSGRIANVTSEWLVPTRQSGAWQVTLSRPGGTTVAVSTTLSIAPLMLALESTAIEATTTGEDRPLTSTVRVRDLNALGNSQITGKIELRLAPEKVAEEFIVSDINEEISTRFDVPTAGRYFFAVEPVDSADVRIWRPSCFVTQRGADGITSAPRSAPTRDNGMAISLSGTELPRLELECVPFERGPSGDRQTEQLRWRAQLFRSPFDTVVPDAQRVAATSAPLRIGTRTRAHEMTWTTSANHGAMYEAVLKPVLANESGAPSEIVIGTVRVF